jgi:hypothetical protein
MKMNDYDKAFWLDNRYKSLVLELDELEREITELEGQVSGKKQYRTYLLQEIEANSKARHPK